MMISTANIGIFSEYSIISVIYFLQWVNKRHMVCVFPGIMMRFKKNIYNFNLIKCSLTADYRNWKFTGLKV